MHPTPSLNVHRVITYSKRIVCVNPRALSHRCPITQRFGIISHRLIRLRHELGMPKHLCCFVFNQPKKKLAKANPTLSSCWLEPQKKRKKCKEVLRTPVKASPSHAPTQRHRSLFASPAASDARSCRAPTGAPDRARGSSAACPAVARTGRVVNLGHPSKLPLIKQAAGYESKNLTKL